jgi:hypothetical protein
LIRSSSLTNDNCSSAFDVVRKNADAQTVQKYTETTLLVSCGRWDPVAATHYTAYSGGATPSGSPAPTAVSVWVSTTFNSFFGVWASREVSAVAIATADAPTAVFSVGSKLLQVNNSGALSKLLEATGVNVAGTSALSYQGLANVKVTPGGLLGALGFNIPLNADVGTIKNLVAAGSGQCPSGTCPLEKLLDAIGTVGGQSSLINSLGIKVEQVSLPVKLLTDAAGGGLFALVDAANGQFALQANTNALGLVTTAIGVANSKRTLDLSLGSGILNTQIGIVEPPSIGIGGLHAKAYTSQVRLFAHVDAPSPSTSLLRKVLTIDLPIAIDLVSGSGEIIEICKDGTETATIRVMADLVRTCVGDINSGSVFSTKAACDSNLLPKKDSVTILTASVLPPLSFSFPLLSSPSQDVTLSKGQTKQAFPSNPLQIGTAIKAVIANVLGKLLNQGQGGVTNKTLAAQLLTASGNSLGDAVNTLNDSLSSLKTFVNGLDANVKAILSGELSAGVINLLSGVGNLLTGLLTSVGNLLNNLLGNVACLLSGEYNQCMLEKQLSGSQTSGGNTISNVLLSLLGLAEKLLQPLDQLGGALSGVLSSLGIDTGQVDVTLIDLKCGGGDTARLVY